MQNPFFHSHLSSKTTRISQTPRGATIYKALGIGSSVSSTHPNRAMWTILIQALARCFENLTIQPPLHPGLRAHHLRLAAEGPCSTAQLVDNDRAYFWGSQHGPSGTKIITPLRHLDAPRSNKTAINDSPSPSRRFPQSDKMALNNS